MQTELMLPHGHPRLAIRSESLRFFISFLVACRHYAARHDVETLLPGVLELRQCFDRLLGRAGQDELAVLLLQLGHRNRDIVLPEAHEAARTDDHEGGGP